MLVLREVNDQQVRFTLHDQDGSYVRGVIVGVMSGRPWFPWLDSSEGVSLGSDRADEDVRLRAGEELVRFHSATDAARRAARYGS